MFLSVVGLRLASQKTRTLLFLPRVILDIGSPGEGEGGSGQHRFGPHWPEQVKPPGFHTTARELQTCTFQRSQSSKHHHNSTKRPEKREERMNIVAQRGGPAEGGKIELATKVRIGQNRAVQSGPQSKVHG